MTLIVTQTISHQQHSKKKRFSMEFITNLILFVAYNVVFVVVSIAIAKTVIYMNRDEIRNTLETDKEK